jgi:dTDP-4-dehydrorhamnose reductase
MKIAIIGADGQLGTDISIALRNSHFDTVDLTIKDLDITQIAAVQKVLHEQKPQVVINTAAFHDVPRCEKEPETAFLVNGIGARNLAMVCNEIDACLMQISTDYVFDGQKKAPYLETDIPMPLNVYANTKLSGEYFVACIAKKHFILRVSGIYGKTPCIGKGGNNFVELMLKLSKTRPEIRVVDDEFLTPTSTVEISRQIVKILQSNPPYGWYHCTAEGSCSWYEFAQEIFEITKPTMLFNKALPGEFKIEVNRPTYSVLENKNLKDQGINIMRHWKEGLREYLGC